MMPNTNIRLADQIGSTLKSLRKGKGLSQANLGQLVGLSQERISVIEKNPGSVNVHQLLQLLIALDAHLMIGKPDNPVSHKEDEW